MQKPLNHQKSFLIITSLNNHWMHCIKYSFLSYLASQPTASAMLYYVWLLRYIKIRLPVLPVLSYDCYDTMNIIIYDRQLAKMFWFRIIVVVLIISQAWRYFDLCIWRLLSSWVTQQQNLMNEFQTSFCFFLLPFFLLWLVAWQLLVAKKEVKKEEKK